MFIKVPTEYLQDYKDALGPDYKYIYAWNPDESGDDKPVTPCATPSISYESGELKFASETAGAEYHYTITDADMVSDAYSKEGKVSLSAAYNISVYATADGYAASEKTEATLYWINANLETANINLAKTRGIVASAHDGIVSISGLDNGEVVKFYAADDITYPSIKVWRGSVALKNAYFLSFFYQMVILFLFILERPKKTKKTPSIYYFRNFSPIRSPEGANFQ